MVLDGNYFFFAFLMNGTVWMSAKVWMNELDDHRERNEMDDRHGMDEFFSVGISPERYREMFLFPHSVISN